MNERKEKKYSYCGTNKKGIERTSFYTPECQLDEEQKYLLRVVGSQLLGYRRPLKKEAWLVEIKD